MSKDLETSVELINPQPEGQAPISGYRKLPQTDIDLINRIKSMGTSIEALMKEIEAHPFVDQRWLANANDNIQTGLMQATRSIAQPNTYA